MVQYQCVYQRSDIESITMGMQMKGIQFGVSDDTKKIIRCDGINNIAPSSYMACFNISSKKLREKLKVEGLW